MGIQITPEKSGMWQLRATILKTATTSPDNRLFIPPFDTGKTYSSQFIAAGINVKDSRDNWRNGGYLAQEFTFPSYGYRHNRKAFYHSEELLINDVSILNFPPLSNGSYRLRYFAPTYFPDVKLQIWEYIGVKTDLLNLKLDLILDKLNSNG